MESNGHSAADGISQELRNLDTEAFPKLHALAESELLRLRGGIPEFVDLISDNPVKLRAKVAVPPFGTIPGVNFVGRLLGPGGQTLKAVQEATKTRLAILGSGSTRDQNKEKELLASGDAKHLHFRQKLHLQVDTVAPPAEAYYRLSYALAELRKAMVPPSDGAPPTGNWAPDVAEFQGSQSTPPSGQADFSPRGGRGGRPFVRGNMKSPNNFRGGFRGRGASNGSVGSPGNTNPSAMPNATPNFATPNAAYANAPPPFDGGNGFQSNQFEQFAAGYGNDASWGMPPQADTRGRGRAHPYGRPGPKYDQ